MEKGQTFEITITDMSDNGEGIGRTCGYTLFVKDAVIGDTISGKIIKAKSSYGYGRLEKIIRPSPFRTGAVCPVARPCGGCRLQEMSYERQLSYKEDKVKNALMRIGGFSEEEIPISPIIGSEKPFRYRCKTQFPFGRSKDGRIIYGFYAGRTHSVVETGDCPVGMEVNRRILETVRSFMEEFRIEPYDEKTAAGAVRHVFIRNGYYTGEIMTCIVVNRDNLPHGDVLAGRLMDISGMTSVFLNINKDNTNVILGRKFELLAGKPYITDTIGDLKYHISPQSFYQVNPVQTEKLYGKVLEFANLTGRETVWDLCCGIGTISLFLARFAKNVYGVEAVPAAVENAKENAVINGIGNAEFFTGKAENIVTGWAEEGGSVPKRADVIVVDPPRKGCDARLLEAMAEAGPGRIIYVSCNPATLARDVKYLRECGYRPERVQPVDMFPQCPDTETVFLLSRRDGLQRADA